MKQKTALGTVQETLLIPLWARAVECNKPYPTLCDPKAAEILGQIDYDFSKFEKAAASQAGCCIRGRLMDELTLDVLHEEPDALIVEIGAGLDTRFERLEQQVRRWIDLDLPDSMALRRQFFTESEKRTFIACSVLEEDWIGPVKQAAGSAPVIFLAEGVLMYFAEEQIIELLTTLAAHFPGSRLIFDSLGPKMVTNQKRHDSLKHTSARFQWGISDIRRLEQWAPCRVEKSLTQRMIPKEVWNTYPFKTRLMLTLGVWMKYRINRIRFIERREIGCIR